VILDDCGRCGDSDEFGEAKGKVGKPGRGSDSVRDDRKSERGGG
jgi:hypothetical protein